MCMSTAATSCFEVCMKPFCPPGRELLSLAIRGDSRTPSCNSGAAYVAKALVRKAI